MCFNFEMCLAHVTRLNFRKELPVYNGAAGKYFKMTIKQMLDIGINGLCEEIPMQHMIMIPSGGVTLSKSLNLIRLFFYQAIPALFLDMILTLKKKKPR